MQGAEFNEKLRNSLISLKIGDFHLKSPKITILVKILHFHGFWVKKRTSAAPGQNALKTNRKSMNSGVEFTKIANFRRFYVNLVILGDFPPISRFWVKIALFALFAKSRATHLNFGRAGGSVP